MGKGKLQVSLARMVSASSPCRRSGSTLNLAPSSSPTPSSPLTTGSKGALLLDCQRAGAVAKVGMRAARMRREDGRMAFWRAFMMGSFDLWTINRTVNI